MSDSVLGILLAAAASSCFNLAIVVQATEARENFYREVQQVIDEEARAPRP